MTASEHRGRVVGYSLYDTDDGKISALFASWTLTEKTVDFFGSSLSTYLRGFQCDTIVLVLIRW